jgi:hypothetical protein
MDAIDSAGEGRAPGAGLGRSIAVVALVWTGFAALNATQVWVSMIDHHHSFPRILGYHLAVWGVWALLTPLVLRLGARLPLVPPRATAVAVHLAAALAASAVHLVTWAVLTAALEPYDVRNPVGFAESFRMGLWLRAQLELLVYASLVAVAAALEVRRRLHQREREAARFEVQLAEAKLHALELQLRPPSCSTPCTRSPAWCAPAATARRWTPSSASPTSSTRPWRPSAPRASPWPARWTS